MDIIYFAYYHRKYSTDKNRVKIRITQSQIVDFKNTLKNFISDATLTSIRLIWNFGLKLVVQGYHYIHLMSCNNYETGLWIVIT